MTDDELMQAIAKVYAEPSADPRYEGLSSGKATLEEVVELESQATRSERDALTLEAFRPLSDGFRAQIMERIETNLAKNRSARSLDATCIHGSTHSSTRESPLARSYYWRIAAPAAIGAIAAAMAILVVVPLQPRALPEYNAFVTGQERDIRSNDSARNAPVFSSRSSLQVVLRPETNVRDPIKVYTFIEHGGDLKPWHASYERSSSGTIRIGTTASTVLPKKSGRYSLVFVITQERNIFSDNRQAQRIAQGERASQRDWRVVRVPIRVR